MPLYTVTVVFEDRTFAVEQVEADTPQHALEVACRQAEALAEHDGGGCRYASASLPAISGGKPSRRLELVSGATGVCGFGRYLRWYHRSD
jgi:hypothetical protein